VRPNRIPSFLHSPLTTGMPTLYSVLNFLALVVAIVGGSWELLVKPRLMRLGYRRVLVPTNNGYCTKVPELAACESESLFSHYHATSPSFLKQNSSFTSQQALYTLRAPLLQAAYTGRRLSAVLTRPVPPVMTTLPSTTPSPQLSHALRLLIFPARAD
jgi:hypothetical protein